MKKAILAALVVSGSACASLPVPGFDPYYYPGPPDVAQAVEPTPDGTIEVLEAQCGADFAPCPANAPVCCAREDGLVLCSKERDCSWPEQEGVQPWYCLSNDDCGGDRPFCCMSVGSSCQPRCDIEVFPQVCQDDSDCGGYVPKCVKPYMKPTPPGVGRCGV